MEGSDREVVGVCKGENGWLNGLEGVGSWKDLGLIKVLEVVKRIGIKQYRTISQRDERTRRVLKDCFDGGGF